MRFLHTADWHLGRIFHSTHLTDDQGVLLDQLADLARERKPDFLLIAGDIYDRSVPPPEAVELLNRTLCRLVLDVQVPVIVIAGNHDSPERIDFASPLLATKGLHIIGALSSEPKCVSFEDQHGPVDVWAVPYVEPAVARHRLGDENVHTHSDAMKAVIGRCGQGARLGNGNRPRSILVTHAFVTGGEVCESERPLSVGGSGAVDGACFDGFDYVALGHLHGPHQVHREGMWYSGSLMKYSFSEATHQKSVSLVEMDGTGRCKVEHIRLMPRRDVRRVRGHLNELLNGPTDGQSREDYLEITLLDEGAIYDAMGKLRAVYPNVLHVQRAILEGSGNLSHLRPDHRRISDRELFATFFEQTTGLPLSEEQTGAYVSVVDDMRQAEREATA